MPANELDAMLMLALMRPEVTSMLVPSGVTTPGWPISASAAKITPSGVINIAALALGSALTPPKYTVLAGCSSDPRTVERTFCLLTNP
jgi:hypothetical protein